MPQRAAMPQWGALKAHFVLPSSQRKGLVVYTYDRRRELESQFALCEPEMPHHADPSEASGELILRPTLQNVAKNFAHNLPGRESVFMAVAIIFAVEVSGHGSAWWVAVLGIGVVAGVAALICTGSVTLVVQHGRLHIQRRFIG